MEIPKNCFNSANSMPFIPILINSYKKRKISGETLLRVPNELRYLSLHCGSYIIEAITIHKEAASELNQQFHF